jgi:hypothetical protein
MMQTRKISFEVIDWCVRCWHDLLVPNGQRTDGQHHRCGEVFGGHLQMRPQCTGVNQCLKNNFMF